MKRIFLLLSFCLILCSCSKSCAEVKIIDDNKFDDLLSSNETYYVYYADKNSDEANRIVELIQSSVRTKANIYLFDLSPYRNDREKIMEIGRKYGLTHSTFLHKRSGKKVLKTFVFSELPYDATPKEVKEIRGKDDADLLKFLSDE